MRLILDAGPLIALFQQEDADHQVALDGFGKLREAAAKPFLPVPVAYEVFKWLLYRSGPDLAREALERMLNSLVTLEGDFAAACALVRALPGWGGSLEDATVAVLAQELGVPVWTLNYRDFSAFKLLELWNP